MDPYAVLGVRAGATPDEIARAYREQAKRHHPDRVGAAGQARMTKINEAYEALRDGEQVTALPHLGGPRPMAPDAGRHRATPARGNWLPAATRKALGPELLAALLPREPVLLVTEAATWDSHDVVLVVTDQRLLWLREDAFVQRVKTLRLAQIERVDGRLKRPRKRVGELRIQPREGGRARSFSEIKPAALERLLRLLTPHAGG